METETYLKSEIDIFDYIISFTDKNPSVGVCSTRCECENLYGRSLGSPIKPHKSHGQYCVCQHVASMQATRRRRILLMRQSVAGVSSPLLLQGCAQSLERSWSWKSLSYTLAENGPNMLDRRQVKGSIRPIEMIHIVLLQELLYYPRPMRSCVVILQHYVVP